jgi:hypothetical protein
MAAGGYTSDNDGSRNALAGGPRRSTGSARSSTTRSPTDTRASRAWSSPARKATGARPSTARRICWILGKKSSANTPARSRRAIITGAGAKTPIISASGRRDRRSPPRRRPASAVPADNGLAALFAVVCGDVAWPVDLRAYQREVASDRRAYPLTNGMPAKVWPCARWRFRPIEPPVTVTGHGPRNVLILQNLRDPGVP